MRRIWFLSISLVLHLVLFVSLVDLEVSRRSAVPDVYEVSIVATPGIVAPAGRVSSAPARGVAPRGGTATGKGSPKYVRLSGRTKTPSIEGIGRERGVRGKGPELKPTQIEPGVREDIPFDPLALAGQREPAPEDPAVAAAGVSAAGKRGSVGARTASDEAIWQSRVRETVFRVWRMPPEVAFFDGGLKTTYQLQVSRDGSLVDKKLVVSSGNKLFDHSIFLALGRVQRFAAPPLSLVAGTQEVEVIMTFWPPAKE